MNLLRTSLGSTGEQVSILGCGTMWFKDMSQDDTDEALNYCLDRGVTYFDCARGYGDAEIKIGNAIGHRRDEFFMATKAIGRDASTAYQQINESCERLATDHLDLLQLHYVNYQEEFDQMVSHFLRDLPGLFHNRLIRPVVYLSLQFRSTVKSRLS